MFDDARKYMKRKMNKLEYANVSLPEGYDEAEREYKKLRDNLDMVEAVIKGLSHYEYGGQTFKHFASLSNLMASKSKIKALKREDIYTDASLVGEALADSVENKPFKETSRQFSDAMMKIAEGKTKMNAKLHDAQSSLDMLKKMASNIDDKRKTVFNLRYDLEEAAQAGNSIDGRMKSEYNTSSNEVLNEMKEFVGDAGISGVLKKIASAQKDFSASSVDYLSKVK